MVPVSVKTLFDKWSVKF